MVVVVGTVEITGMRGTVQAVIIVKEVAAELTAPCPLPLLLLPLPLMLLLLLKRTLVLVEGEGEQLELPLLLLLLRQRRLPSPPSRVATARGIAAAGMGAVATATRHLALLRYLHLHRPQPLPLAMATTATNAAGKRRTFLLPVTPPPRQLPIRDPVAVAVAMAVAMAVVLLTMWRQRLPPTRKRRSCWHSSLSPAAAAREVVATAAVDRVRAGSLGPHCPLSRHRFLQVRISTFCVIFQFSHLFSFFTALFCSGDSEGCIGCQQTWSSTELGGAIQPEAATATTAT